MTEHFKDIYIASLSHFVKLMVNDEEVQFDFHVDKIPALRLLCRYKVSS